MPRATIDCDQSIQLLMDSPTSSSSSSSSSSDDSISFEGKKAIKRGPLHCAICYGKATGHHYDVPSCNGCKSFFRRVTIEKLSYSCRQHGKCYDEIKTGERAPKCRSCRFRKCVELGMNPLGIQSELRKRLKEGNTSDSKIQTKIIGNTIEDRISIIIDTLLYVDKQASNFRSCAYNPSHIPSLEATIKNDRSLLSLAEKYGPMDGWPLSGKSREELNQMIEVGDPRRKKWFDFDVLVCIEHAKTFEFYKELSFSDRYYLLRETALMLTNLTRTFYSFSRKFDEIVYPDGVLSYGAIFWNEQLCRLILQIRRRAFEPLIRLSMDEVEYVLLKAVVLCNSTIDGLSENGRKLIAAERLKYANALFYYETGKHGICGAARVANILNVVDLLQHQQRDQRDAMIMAIIEQKDRTPVPLLDDVLRVI